MSGCGSMVEQSPELDHGYGLVGSSRLSFGWSSSTLVRFDLDLDLVRFGSRLD